MVTRYLSPILRSAIAVVLTLALALPLAACGGGDAGNGGDNASDPPGHGNELENSSGPETPTFKETLDYEQDPGIQGNTPGNLANGGNEAWVGDSFLLRCDRLYPDNREVRFTSDFPFYLNVSGNTVYYLTDPYDDSNIWKCGLDGSAIELVYTSDDLIAAIWLHGDWIYYGHVKSGKTYVSRVKTDGSGNTLVLDSATWDNGGISSPDSFCLGQNAIYYSGSQGKLYKAELDGSNPRPLGDFPVSNQRGAIIIHGEWIYYIRGYSDTGSGGLFRIKTDGTDNMPVMDQEPFKFSFMGNELYYIAMDKDGMVGWLYAINADGTGEARLVYSREGASVFHFAVLGEEIYVDCGDYYFVRPDGSLVRWRHFIGEWKN